MQNLMKKWKDGVFERVGNVEKALLKIAVYEILCEDTPTRNNNQRGC